MTSFSRYTPSLLTGETLEALFVARERPLELLMARVQQAAQSDIRNHSLIVGPRGAGKTHLLSLVAHRTRALIEGGAHLQLSWLPEDPWTIVSYASLLRAVLKHSGQETGPGQADHEYEALLSKRVRVGGPVVVVSENLDQVLNQIGDEGQQRLRHLLQTTDQLLIIASSTRLDRTLTSASAPFYNFFTTTQLEAFSVEEARSMLQKIARQRGDEELAVRLESDEATARLRTIAHLAGGQPRLWSALSDALTASGVRGLIDTLLTRFDDLTPYYQEQLSRLSPHQRLAVAELASADHPVHVSELAQNVAVEQRSMAKTLKELRDLGWVRPTTSPFADLLDARRTYYELAEPLARLSFQIKETRGEPLRLVVDFLTAWFDPEDADTLDADHYTVRMIEEFKSNAASSVIRTLSRLPRTRVPSINLLGQIDDALASIDEGDPTPILQLPTPLRVALEARLATDQEPLAHLNSVRTQIHHVALEEMGSIPHPLSTSWLRRAELMVDSRGANALLTLLLWQLQSWNFDAAETTLSTMRISGWPPERVLLGRGLLASAYLSAGQITQSIITGEMVLQDSLTILDPDDHRALTARNNLACSYEAAGRISEATQLYEATLADSERVLGAKHPDTLTSRHNLAGAYDSAGDLKTAIRMYEATLIDREELLGAEHEETLTTRDSLAGAFESAGRLDEALPLYETTLKARERLLGAEHPDTLTSRNNLAGAYESAGNLELAIRLYRDTLAARERLLGAEHPSTLTSRNNLAYALGAGGDRDTAIALYEDVLSVSERTLGSAHPHTLASRNNLGHSYLETGRPERAVELLGSTLVDRERVLGPKHPETIASRSNLAAAYAATGEPARALALYEEALADAESIRGSEHPDTRAIRDALMNLTKSK